MRIFSLYGFTSDNIIEISKALEDLLLINFEKRNSTFIGEYYNFRDEMNNSLKLQTNFINEDDWAEPKHKDYFTLLYISGTEISIAMEEKIIKDLYYVPMLLKRTEEL